MNKQQHFFFLRIVPLSWYYLYRFSYYRSRLSMSVMIRYTLCWMCECVINLVLVHTSWYLFVFNLSGSVDGDASEWSVTLPCRTRPHWLEPVMYASESAPEKASPSEGLSLEPYSMLSVAVKVSSHITERNVKARHIILHESCLKLKCIV